MPALPQLYPYKAGPIEPVVMPGETVGVWVNKAYNFFKVDYIDGIPASDPVIVDFGAVGAGANTNVIQVQALEMPTSEFGQFRAEVLDDCTAMLYQGRSDQRHKTNQRVSTYSLFGAQRDPDGHSGEFYVHEDNWAYLQVFNQTGYALAQTRVAFWGFRYVLTSLDKEFDYKAGRLPPSWTRIPATAHL
jgi:hypothetical protein